MKFCQFLKTFLLSIMIGMLCQLPAQAEEKPGKWQVEAGLYGFIPISVDGSSTVDGGTVDLDLGPDEIFELLQFAIAGRAEGWRPFEKGDGSAFGLILDANYVDLGLETDIAGGDLDIDIEQIYVDILAAYRFVPITLGQNSGQSLAFDVTGGVRYNYLKQEIDVSPGLAAPFTADLGGSKNWFEPVVGVGGNLKLNDRWNLVLRGDVAGFDLEDNIAWSVTGLAAWRFAEKTSFRFGYRIFDMDYSTGSGAKEFGLDITQHGPFVALSYSF